MLLLYYIQVETKNLNVIHNNYIIFWCLCMWVYVYVWVILTIESSFLTFRLIICFEIESFRWSHIARNILSISILRLPCDFLIRLNLIFKQIIISRVFLLIRPYSITVYRFYYQIFIYYIIKQDLKTNFNKIRQHFKNLFSQLQYYTHDLIMSFLLNKFHSMSNKFIIKSTTCAY